MVIRFAQNPRGKGLSTMGALLNNLNLKFSIPEFTRFISAACSGMSTTEHQLFLAKLEQNKDMYINVGIDSENTVAIDTAFASCQRQILENESKLDKYLTDVTEFLCGNTDACSPVTKCPSSTNFRYRNWRLPEHYHPEHYEVALDLDGLAEEDKTDGSFYYRARSIAHFSSTEDVCHITMHVNEQSLMNVDSGRVAVDGRRIYTVEVRDDNYQYYHFVSDLPIKAGSRVLIETEVTVKLLENPTRGLYLSSYLEAATSKRKYLLATHLESTAARKVFPCFDEPGWKTKFDFSIKFKYPEEYTAIFNTQPKSTIMSTNGDFATNVYHTTVAMPTYLLAIVVSPYAVDNSGISKKETLVRILGRPDYADQTDFALNEAMSIIDNMSDFFEVDYCDAFIDESAVVSGNKSEVCKSDQAGIPTFSPGAMENWGLILYREYYLFINEKRDSKKSSGVHFRPRNNASMVC